MGCLPRSGQPGEITRICGCESEELMHRPVFWLMPTWITAGVTSHGDDKCAASLASVQSLCTRVHRCHTQCAAKVFLLNTLHLRWQS